MIFTTSWDIRSNKEKIVKDNLIELMTYPPIKQIIIPANKATLGLSFDVPTVRVKNMQERDTEIDLMCFFTDVSLEGYLFYCRQKPLGLPFLTCYNFELENASRLAVETRFWLSIHMWCCHSDRYKKFRKGMTLGIVIRPDKIPTKTKQKWCRRFVKRLSDNKLIEEYLGEN